MTKSIIEKERLSKIKAFKNGECDFDDSMLKVKIRFENYTKDDTKRKTGYQRKSASNINKESYLSYKMLFTKILAGFSKKMQIFDITVKAVISTEFSYTFSCCQKKYDTSKKCMHIYFELEHNNKNLCGIMTKKELENINLDIDSKLSINDFLKLSYNNIEDVFAGPKIYLNSLVSINVISDNRRVFKRVKKPSKLPKEFKEFEFYKNMNFLFNYIKNNNDILRFPYYAVTYNLFHNKYYAVSVKDFRNKCYTLMRHELFKSNIDILQGFEKMGVFPFEIGNANIITEKEILDTYSLFNY